MRLKYEPSLEPVHISAKKLFLNCDVFSLLHEDYVELQVFQLPKGPGTQLTWYPIGAPDSPRFCVWHKPSISRRTASFEPPFASIDGSSLPSSWLYPAILSFVPRESERERERPRETERQKERDSDGESEAS